MLTLQYGFDTVPTVKSGLCPLSLKLDWLLLTEFLSRIWQNCLYCLLKLGHKRRYNIHLAG